MEQSEGSNADPERPDSAGKRCANWLRAFFRRVKLYFGSLLGEWPLLAPILGRRPWVALVVSFLFFVLALGIFTRNNDFPYVYHPDESSKAGQLLSWKRNCHHPQMMLTVASVYSLAKFGVRNEQEAVVVGRWASATLGALAVAGFVLLAWYLSGWMAACAAGLLLLSSDLLIELAHYFKEDPALLGGMVAAFLAICCYRFRPCRLTAFLAGVGAACAASGKYVGFLVAILALGVVIFAKEAGALPRKSRMKHFGAGFLVVFGLWNFLMAFYPDRVVRVLGREMDHAVGGQSGIQRSVPHGLYFEILPDHVAMVLVCLAGIHLLFLLFSSNRSRIDHWFPILSGAVFFLALSCVSLAGSRYFLPVVAVFLFLAAMGIADLAKLAGLPLRRWGWIISVPFWLALTAWCISLQLPAARRTFDAFAHDDRKELFTYLRNEIPSDAFLAADGRVDLPCKKLVETGAFPEALPQKIKQADFIVSLVESPPTVDKLVDMGVTHAVVSHGNFERFFVDASAVRSKDSQEFEERHAFYRELFERGELLWEKGRGLNTYLQPGLRLYRLPSSEAPAAL